MRRNNNYYLSDSYRCMFMTKKEIDYGEEEGKIKVFEIEIMSVWK